MRKHILFLMAMLGGTSILAGTIADAGDTYPATVSSCHAEEGGDTLTVALTGDIMMGTTYPRPMLPPSDGALLFSDARSILRSADIAAGNLEGALCDSGETRKKVSQNVYAFRMPERYASLLADAGYDFVSMANNHAHDFGDAGVISTEKALDGAGIKYAGLHGRATAAYIERGSVTYGFCAFGFSPYTQSLQDTANVRTVVENLRANADIVIVSFHGGAEGAASSHLPDSTETFLGENRGDLRAFAKLCVDCGADIVYGHGPHVPRCVELYRGRLIAYSLGNFCTPYGINLSGVSGMAPILCARISHDGRFLGGKIYSMKQSRGTGPRHDATSAAARRIKALTDEDAGGGGLTIYSDGRIAVR